ncbi:hypothetical protein H2248_003303 [Termitomyces sp. 'cryptogamus']|nr:hypothetical protein H2248_003303 [Termitomyces sp. 'cryptogamus']
MHFSKTYAQLLLSLPPEIRENAIQYRQLKKLIHDVVRELASLGLTPSILHELLGSSKEQAAVTRHRDEGLRQDNQYQHAKAVYEVTDESGPHLRLWVDAPTHTSNATLMPLSIPSEEEPEAMTDYDAGEDSDDSREAPQGQTSLLWRLQRMPEIEPTTAQITECLEDDISLPPEEESSPSVLFGFSGHDHEPELPSPGENRNEVVILLASDKVFIRTLLNSINGLSAHLLTMQSHFVETLNGLSRTIAKSARPISRTTSGFHPHSVLLSKSWNINPTNVKSDLYSWREIFQLYVEAEVFESVHELDRGERSVEESEKRLKQFAERVTVRGLGDERKLKSKSSREALETFLELNVFILNIKKFQYASAEATRKILKKHTKRTSLPLFTDKLSSHSQAVVLANKHPPTLPRTLVQAIGEILLPIIPQIDDYSCLICTSIAFKPIRLSCGHLFCVRCLVKMQKRGNGNCPMCRAPCVLTANRTNVDWALLNFMQDWFPIEAHEKLTQNQKEATKEQFEELGLDPDQACTVM